MRHTASDAGNTKIISNSSFNDLKDMKKYRKFRNAVVSLRSLDVNGHVIIPMDHVPLRPRLPYLTT